MAIPDFVSRPRLEDYKEQFKDYFHMERKNGVLLVRMHYKGGPVKWTFQAHQACGQVWHTIGNDPENEVMILTCAGDTWIHDGDKEADAATEHHVNQKDPSTVIYEYYLYDTNKLVTNLINDIDIPTIGVINGPGFHTEMGLLCDISLCTPDCEFGDHHFMMGWVPGDGQLLVFQQLIGLKRAAYHLYTGNNIDAQTALEWGLVNEVVPREKIIDRAYELAGTIMKQHRVNRRVTAQLIKRPWKRLITNDYDLHVSNEFYGLQVTQPKHDFEKITKTFHKPEK